MEKEMRCHFLIVVTKTLRATWALVVIVLFSALREMKEVLLEDRNGEILVLFGICILLIASIFLFNFLRWRKTYIKFENDTLIIDRRFLLNKRQTNIKRNSIATVNTVQNIFEKLFGIYHLKLDINSSVTANQTDVELVFAKEDADKLRGILTGVTKAEEEDAIIPQTSRDERVVREFSIGHLMVHSLMDISILLVLCWASVFYTALGGLFLEFHAKGIAFGILAAAVIVVPTVFNFCKSVFRYYGFNIAKENDRMIIRYGFFTAKQFIVPLERVSAVVIEQSVWARMFRRYKGKVICVGMNDNESAEMPLFSLYVTRAEIDDMMKKIMPEYRLEDEGIKCPGKAFISSINFCVVSVIVMASVVGVVFYNIGMEKYFNLIGLGSLALLAFMLFIAYMSFRAWRLFPRENICGVMRGVFARRTTIITYGKIQTISLSKGPILKRLHVYGGDVTILASTGYQNQSIGKFQEETMELIAAQIESHSVKKRIQVSE